MERWDAIIVGAGPAGCAAAYDLGAAGRAVLLLDRAEFPRHKACAGGLTRKSLQALRYSVAPVTREVVSAIVVEKQAGESAKLASRYPVCAMTVRRELDQFCLQQTLAAGAKLIRTGQIVKIAAGKEGIVLHAGERRFSGSFLIGADGVHSRIRQLLFSGVPPWFRRGFALEAEVYQSERATQDTIFDFAAVRQGYGWAFPKRDHVNVGLYSESMSERLDRSRLMAWIGARFRVATVENLSGQYLGFGAENAAPAEGRIFLVGDAGGFADPLTGEGIHGAISSGQAAAAAIESELRGARSAARFFAERTDALRSDLRLSAAGARWFYKNIDLGFLALTAPVFRGAVINAYANGTRIAALANAIRRFASAFPGIAQS